MLARRSASLAEISKIGLTRPPQPQHHGLLGEVVHAPIDFLGLGAKQLADVALGIPQGVVELVKAPVLDVHDIVEGKTPYHTADLIKLTGQQVYQDVTHPLSRPGYLAADILSFGPGAYGIAGRVGRVAHYARTGETAAMVARRVAAEKTIKYPRPAGLPGHDEYKGKLLYPDYVPEDIVGIRNTESFFPAAEPPPGPKGVRQRLKQAAQKAGGVFQAPRPHELEFPAGAPLPEGAVKHHPELGQGKTGVTSETRPLGPGRVRLAWARVPKSYAIGLKGSNQFVYQLLKSGPEDQGRWRHIQFPPSETDRLIAQETGQEVANTAPPLYVAYTDAKHAHKALQQAAEELHGGRDLRDLSIVHTANQKFAVNREIETEAWQAKLEAQATGKFKPEDAVAPPAPEPPPEPVPLSQLKEKTIWERRVADVSAREKKLTEDRAHRRKQMWQVVPYLYRGIAKSKQDVARLLDISETGLPAGQVFNEATRELQKAVREAKGKKLTHPKYTKLRLGTKIPERAPTGPPATVPEVSQFTTAKRPAEAFAAGPDVQKLPEEEAAKIAAEFRQAEAEATRLAERQAEAEAGKKTAKASPVAEPQSAAKSFDRTVAPEPLSPEERLMQEVNRTQEPPPEQVYADEGYGAGLATPEDLAYEEAQARRQDAMDAEAADAFAREMESTPPVQHEPPTPAAAPEPSAGAPPAPADGLSWGERFDRTAKEKAAAEEAFTAGSEAMQKAEYKRLREADKAAGRDVSGKSVAERRTAAFQKVIASPEYEALLRRRNAAAKAHKEASETPGGKPPVAIPTEPRTGTPAAKTTKAQQAKSEKAMREGKARPAGKAPTKKVGYRAAPMPEGLTGLEAAQWELQQASREHNFARQHGGDPADVEVLRKKMEDARAEVERRTATEGEAPPETFAPIEEPVRDMPDVPPDIQTENPFVGPEPVRPDVPPTGFTSAPREPARETPAREPGAGVQDQAIRLRQLRSYGVPEEKLAAVQKDLKAAAAQGLSGVSREQLALSIFKKHLGKAEGTAAHKLWRNEIARREKPSQGGENVQPGKNFAVEAIKTFMAPRPSLTRTLGTSTHVRGAYQQEFPLDMRLAHSALLRKAQNLTVDIAEHLAGKKTVDGETASLAEKFRLPQIADAYLKRKKKQAFQRNEVINSALEIGETAASIKDPADKAAYLGKIVEDRTKATEGGAFSRGMDELNMLSSMGVLYFKGPGFLIPNLLGQASILGSETLNPFKAVRAMRLVRDLQTYDPVAFDSMMNTMGQGMADQLRGATGTKGYVGKQTHRSYSFISRQYGKVLDTPWRAAALGLELSRQGFKTPEAAAELFRNPAMRDQLIDVMDRANENAIDYTKMTDFEKRVVRRVIFFYPWIKAASRYSMRYVFEHPAKTFAGVQASRIGAERTQKLLPELPSYLQGVVPLPDVTIPGTHYNIGRENIPGVGEVQKVLNPRAATVQGTLGDVINVARANLVGHNLRSTERIAQFLNPTASVGVGVATGVDPFTGVPVPPDQSNIGLVAQEAQQLFAPRRLIDLMNTGEKIQAGKYPNIQNKLEPRTPGDVTGQIITGMGPVPINPAKAEALAFGEETGAASKSRRVYLRTQRNRETYVKAAVKVGALKPGEQLPQVVRDAFNRKAQRDANIAAFEEQLGHKLDPLERLTADLNLIVRQKRMPAAQATRLLEQLKAAPEPFVLRAYNQIRNYFFPTAVITNYKAYLNAQLVGRGEAPITVP